MFGALRRNAVAHAVRFSSRSLLGRTIPQRPQWYRESLSVTLHEIRTYHSSTISFSAAAQAQQQTEDWAETPVPTRFAELADQGLVHPRIIRTITAEKNIKTMTEVQSMTINETLSGRDVLAQAKTGTGKTIAFLLPVLQNILKDQSIKARPSRNNRPTPSDIRGIIISPTRELAEQIAKEARQLAYGTGVVVQTAVGGTRKREHLMQMKRQGCHLLVGTPGRLKDLLSDPYSGVAAPNLSSFVLDEADRLLDDGFAPDIQELQRMLPDPMKVDRQTLLFSATVPREVMTMVRRTMKPDYKFIRTVKEDEVPTHLAVPQKAVILDGYQNALPAILELAKTYAAEPANRGRPFKAIVYFNSTKQVRIAFEVFLELLKGRDSPLKAHGLGTRIYELHSRLSQDKRTRTSEFFRESRSAILFSSDVTARGMDFPGVTHVLQVGLPRDRPTYIHRLGRTGRANQTGEGWIFLHRGEIPVSRTRLSELPIEVDSSLSMATANMREPLDADEPEGEIITQINSAMSKIPDDSKAEAYLSQLTGSISAFDKKNVLAQAMNDLAVYGYGLPSPPEIPYPIAQKSGLLRVQGLQLDRPVSNDRRPRRSRDERPYGRPRRQSRSRY
ncbi:conserved hypothetical protein [Aspergillus terreus NIH2624]|uniref:ATP-dependent RNA helicase n=1 Tax=Aspergillus terreus (strain NIH 2624 / FGSC A1156) TaxID=341663 RepID=Q0CM47_ASPTN|nr:uncharacterized protein ATEG_05237 [Aspergillus terreus NIH2624]EAU34306.1 conserved hypothetical protein [Aspergillus terreus NIH2624]